MKFNKETMEIATKFADAMVAVIQNDKDIIGKLPEDLDEFFETVRGIFSLKVATIYVQMDEVQEAAKEDEELAGILKLIKIFGGN